MIRRNETIYYIKGLAIISVISAHCNAVLDNTNRFAVYSSCCADYAYGFFYS